MLIGREAGARSRFTGGAENSAVSSCIRIYGLHASFERVVYRQDFSAFSGETEFTENQD